MPSIAIVTTCKGRLHHLRDTLPRFVAQGATEIIVVDYGCPDGAGDWAEANFAGVQVVRIADDPGFCLGRARNLGAAQARSEWLAFLDADTLVDQDWHGWMQHNLAPGHFYRRAPVDEIRDAETHGVAVCSRADFKRIGGYDELYRGWGGEDEDLYNRLTLAGVSAQEFPAELLWAIHHGDDERAGWEGLGNRQNAVDVCACYRLAKQETVKALGWKGELPLDLRRQYMEHVRQRLTAWFDSGRRDDLHIEFDVNVGGTGIIFAISLRGDAA